MVHKFPPNPNSLPSVPFRSETKRPSATPASTATVDDLDWLVGPEGRQWLGRVASESRSLAEWTRMLRRELTAARTHLVLEQHELRARAARRFPDAQQRFFTPVSLQQASDALTAAYKATRFPHNSPVIDLCCGAGGDLCALARRGTVVGIERNPLLVPLARANLRSVLDTMSTGSMGAASEVIQADVRGMSPARWTLVHVDPDRRADSRRSVRLEFHEPDREIVQQWVRQAAGLALKLAPATPMDNAQQDPLFGDAELEWIGHHGECQQLVTWHGQLAQRSGCRVATRLDPAGQPHHFFAPKPAPLDFAPSTARYVAEPIACVLAAGLAGNWAEQHGYRSLTPGGGYLTGDAAVASDWVARYEVLDVLPLREKKIAQWLRARQAGQVIVKQRGLKLDVAAWQRQFSRAEGEPITLIGTRFGKQSRVIATRRTASHGCESSPPPLHDSSDPHRDTR